MLHLAIIAGGPDWYRFFGAGEGMARMAERGMLKPALITLGIAAILAVWAAYAFAGAGLIRAAAADADGAGRDQRRLSAARPRPRARCSRSGRNGSTPSRCWSSLIVLVYGDRLCGRDVAGMAGAVGGPR